MILNKDKAGHITWMGEQSVKTQLGWESYWKTKKVAGR
jgi:hypothetical protein